MGILVAVRRCNTAAAFQELVAAAQRHDVAVFAVAAALVSLATDGDKQTMKAPAVRAARTQWGDLFAPLDAPPD